MKSNPSDNTGSLSEATPTPNEPRSILEQDTAKDTKPSSLAELIKDDAIEDFGPKPEDPEKPEDE